MATTLEIIQGIYQAAANAYDGAHDERFVTGDPKKVGLSREEGCPIIDSRVLDGFAIKIIGDMLQINYEANIKLSDVYAVGFEEGCEQRLEDISTFLKKEYKVLTGKMLSLTGQGEAKCIVQNTSRVRTFVMCHKLYKIGGMKDVETLGEAITDPLDVKFHKFLEEGGFAKKESLLENIDHLTPDQKEEFIAAWEAVQGAKKAVHRLEQEISDFADAPLTRGYTGDSGPGPDHDEWRRAKEELKVRKQNFKDLKKKLNI